MPKPLLIHLPDEVYAALKERSHARQVTLKSLVLEALAETGIKVPGVAPVSTYVDAGELRTIAANLRRVLRHVDSLLPRE